LECPLKDLPARLRDLVLDPSVTDICLNGHQRLSFDRGGGMETVPGDAIFSGEAEYRQFVLEHLSLSGRTWDAKLPFVDTVFFRTHRAHLAFPPVARGGISLSLRRLPAKNPLPPEGRILQAETRWKNSLEAYSILREAVKRHETLLIAGSTGSGKTTLFNDLLLHADPGERIIALEDTAEIHPVHPGFLGLLTRPPNPDGFGTVTLRELVRQTLRMRPDRILIGECRGEEVLDLLLALNTGHRGSLTTVHSNSAVDATRRLELLALLASQGTLPPALIRNLISRGIQKIAHLVREPSGRRISEVLSIEGIEQDVLILRRVFPDASRPVAPGHPGNHRESGSALPRSKA
jgi:pilus assembly protein CpaF